MILVILESPYAGPTEEAIQANVAYARRCLLDSLERGESPIASHLLYTQVLSDSDPLQRKMGIAAGLAWLEVADRMVCYTDRGVSPGMKDAMLMAEGIGVKVVYRSIPMDPTP